jgi:hypothetical protein
MPRIQVTIEGQLTLDDRTAEMLDHLTSYDLSAWFADKCSHKYTKEQIREALAPIRNAVGEVLAARDAAIQGINEKFSPKRKK